MNRRQFLRWGLAVGVSGLGYTFAEARWVEVTRQMVAVPRLPSAFSGKRVALLTDPHVGPFPFAAPEFLTAVVARINALKPDLVALGGDYLYGPESRHYIQPCVRALAGLRAPLGVYAVLGNHDHLYDNAPRLRAALAEHGLVDLTNTGAWIEVDGARLRVAGVDDFMTGDQDLAAALGDATQDDACLLLSHNPDYVETVSDPRVGLVLSGHLHGGQIRLPGCNPLFVPSRYGMKYLRGLVQGPHTQVFVSRGVGTMGVPMRLCCPPEVNLLTLSGGETNDMGND